jgi:hypothetical protein
MSAWIIASVTLPSASGTGIGDPATAASCRFAPNTRTMRMGGALCM